MPIIRAPRPDRDFTVIRNEVINDGRLSLEARFVLIYLLSKPDTWRVSVTDLVNQSKHSARKSGSKVIYAVIKELLNNGYMARRWLSDGGMDYTVYEEPRETDADPDRPYESAENPEETAAVQPFSENGETGAEPLIQNGETEAHQPFSPNRKIPNRKIPNALLVKTEEVVRTEKAEKTDASFVLEPSAAKPKSRKRSGITMREFLDNCNAAGEQPFPEGDPIFKYGDDTDIPFEMLKLAWMVFKDRFLESGDKKSDWRAQYRTYVKRGWLRLWYFDANGDCKLTTAGEQARRVHQPQAHARYDSARYAS